MQTAHEIGREDFARANALSPEVQDEINAIRRKHAIELDSWKRNGRFPECEPAPLTYESALAQAEKRVADRRDYLASPEGVYRSKVETIRVKAAELAAKVEEAAAAASRSFQAERDRCARLADEITALAASIRKTALDAGNAAEGLV